MRKVPGQKPGTLVAFTPETLKDPDDPTQVVVWLKVPSESDKRAHLCEITGGVKVDGAGNPSMTLSLADVFERRRAAIVRFVDHVDHYVDQTDTPIVTGAELWEYAPLAVSNDVDAEIETLLGFGAVEKKGSAASSASSTAESSSAAVTAPDVTLTYAESATATGGAKT